MEVEVSLIFIKCHFVFRSIYHMSRPRFQFHTL